jgi:hypothetical protein
LGKSRHGMLPLAKRQKLPELTWGKTSGLRYGSALGAYFGSGAFVVFRSSYRHSMVVKVCGVHPRMGQGYDFPGACLCACVGLCLKPDHPGILPGCWLRLNDALRLEFTRFVCLAKWPPVRWVIKLRWLSSMATWLAPVLWGLPRGRRVRPWVVACTLEDGFGWQDFSGPPTGAIDNIAKHGYGQHGQTWLWVCQTWLRAASPNMAMGFAKHGYAAIIAVRVLRNGGVLRWQRLRRQVSPLWSTRLFSFGVIGSHQEWRWKTHAFRCVNFRLLTP